MSNLFANAPVAKAPPKTKVKNVKDEIEIAGVEDLAQLHAMIVTLGSVAEVLTAEVKGQMREIFIDKAVTLGKRPENFKGVEGVAVASCELRKRASTSALTEEQIKILATAGLPVGKEVAVPELFAINPAYATDTKLLEKVSRLIEKSVPADFIIKQAEISKTVVLDTTVEEAFKLGDKLTPEIFDIVGVLGFKPTLTTVNLGAIFDKMKKMILPATVTAALDSSTKKKAVKA